MDTFIIILSFVLGLAFLCGGIFCLVRYAQTRRNLFLILGLVFTFVVPGLLVCFVFGIWIPNTIVAYGPPPPTLKP